ncbi:cupin-like domain-containing protein [Paraburkholderia tropica]|uniref:cupin-like domain-containing protein n=1 Tax=Paraburkholderia tropica TaxID=92647 RepID=UPI002AB70A40|nr:cupin-like domain-containing protein [Paraburkholderia tropica]
MLINEAPVLTRPLWHTVDPLAACREQLHKAAFAARHPLAGHPLFSIEALTKVAEAACKRKDDVYVDAGDLTLADKWGSTPKPDMTIPEIIDRIETAGAWLVMKHVEKDPAYKALLDEYEAFVREIAGPEGARLLSNAEMLVFITSPLRKTPFHFDAEVNFLVQIQGSKDLWVCDPLDRSITTEEELEQYYFGAINAGTYKPHAEKLARQFTLHPGDAVHIPTHGAHWVQNHDNVSISLSLNMELPRRYGDAYRANYYMRKLGLKPRPPGASEWLDGSKAATVHGLRQVKSLIKR